MAKEDDLKQSLSTSLQSYSDHLARHGSSPCDRYFLIALSDAKVEEHFLQHVGNGELFVGVVCLGGITIPEQVRVLFQFHCLPPKFCFLPPAFLVTLNIIQGSVVDIVDPYVVNERDIASIPEGPGGIPIIERRFSRIGRGYTCGCAGRGRATADPIGELAGIIDAVLGRGITCAIVNRQCGNDQRCNRSFRKLENFHNNPTADTARDLADFMGASSMQERCVRAIIEAADTVDWVIFLAAVAAAAA